MVGICHITSLLLDISKSPDIGGVIIEWPKKYNFEKAQYLYVVLVKKCWLGHSEDFDDDNDKEVVGA